MNEDLQRFLAFSVEATCFTRFELLGTGQAQAYYEATERAVGPALCDLLAVHASLPPAETRDDPARLAALRRQIFGDERLGPVARNVIKLWYIGIWFEMPRAWIEAYGARSYDVETTVPPASYAEGLLWPAIGAHPPGAKAPGYASWVEPPDIPPF